MFEMEKDVREFIAKRCKAALEEDADYMKAELGGNVEQDELECMQQELCYMKGVMDRDKMIKLLESYRLRLNGSLKR